MAIERFSFKTINLLSLGFLSLLLFFCLVVCFLFVCRES